MKITHPPAPFNMHMYTHTHTHTHAYAHTNAKEGSAAWILLLQNLSEICRQPWRQTEKSTLRDIAALAHIICV